MTGNKEANSVVYKRFTIKQWNQNYFNSGVFIFLKYFKTRIQIKCYYTFSGSKKYNFSFFFFTMLFLKTEKTQVWLRLSIFYYIFKFQLINFEILFL